MSSYAHIQEKLEMEFEDELQAELREEFSIKEEEEEESDEEEEEDESDEEESWCFRCDKHLHINHDGGDWGEDAEWVCRNCLPVCLKCGVQLYSASEECCGEGRSDGIEF